MKRQENKFVDFTITEATPTRVKKFGQQYKICSVTKRGSERFINLSIPKEVQDKILQAYAQGKQVRIFA